VQSFTYNANPARVIFGHGTLTRLPEEIERLKARRALILSTPQQADEAARIATLIGDTAAGVFSEARMHTPTDVTARALGQVERLSADLVIAIGGGSTTGLGKAIAYRTDLPQIVIPTTYAGSEATPILGETENGVKRTRSDPKILPEVILYDVDLTLGLPVAMSVTSGMNAIAHAIEALYAREANPVISLLAEDGIRALVRALPSITRDPGNRDARSDALYGAWACGVCLGSVGMALHHKICHTLGGLFDLPHAQLHTAVLPHAVAYNAAAAPEAMRRLAGVLGSDDVAGALYDLAAGLGAQMALADLGMPVDGIDRAVEQALANPYWNPRPIEEVPLRQLIEDALAGRRPA
jgi:maleylacetate reductase